MTDRTKRKSTRGKAVLPEANEKAPQGTLSEFFARSPLPGSGIKLVRRKDRPRPIRFD